MGIFKALKQDLSTKLGVIKEEIKSSDTYQDSKHALKEIAKPYAYVTKEVAKEVTDVAREVKYGILKSAAQKLSNSMPTLSKELRKKGIDTYKKIKDAKEKD